MALTPDEANNMMNPQPEENEQLSLPLGDVLPSEVINSGSGVRQQRVRTSVQRVQIDGLDKNTLTNLTIAIDRLAGLGTSVAPEVAAKHSHHATVVAGQVQNQVQSMKSYEQMLRARVPLENEVSRLIGVQGENLKSALEKHQMLADADDVHKTVTYHYVDEHDTKIPQTKPLEEIEAARKAASSGNATAEQEQTWMRVKRDLLAHEVTDRQKINAEYEKQVKIIKEEVELDKNREAANLRTNDLLKRGTGQIMDRLRAEGLMEGKRGQGTLRYAQTTPTGVQMNVMSEARLGQLLKSSRAGTLTEAEASEFDAVRGTISQSLRPQRGEGMSDTQHFRLSEVIQNIARGNFGGAIGEAMQRIPGRLPDAMVSGAERAGASVTERLGGGFLARGIGSAIPGIAGLALTPAGLFGGYEIGKRVLGQVHQSEQLGMITGQGTGAGISARSAAFMQGINPFDLVSGRMALEFQGAVRSQGYQGGQANQMANLLGDVVNHLGTDWKQALDMATLATREGGSSLKDFKDTLMGLRDMAKDTGTSVQSLQEGLAEFSKTAIAGGATQATASTRFGTAQTAFAGTALGLPQGSSRLQAWMSQSANIIAMSAGVPVWEALSMSAQQWAAQLDKLISRVLEGQPPGMSLTQYAEMLIFMQHPLFAGLDVPGAVALLKRGKGGGFETALSQSTAQQAGVKARRREQAQQDEAWRKKSGLDQTLTDPVRRLKDNLKKEVDDAGKVAGGIWGGITHVFSGSEKGPNAVAQNRAYVQGVVKNLQGQHLTTQQEVQRVQVEIKANPQLLRYFEVADPVYQQYLKGLHGGQGLTRPPG